MSIRKQTVGGITFLRVFVLGRAYVFSFCRTRKSHVLIA